MTKPIPATPPNPYSHREFVPIRAEAVGVTANNPFYQHNSSSRGVMNASHLSQHLVLEGSEEPIIQTGLERELGKHVLDIRMPHDGVIRRVIERYPATAGEDSFAQSPEQIVIYQLESTHEYDCFSIDLMGSSHRSFTYRLQPTEAMAYVRRGNAIAGGTQLAKPSCIGENGGSSWGLNLNTAFMSVDEVAEDCTYISESAARRMAFRMTERRIQQCGTKAFPLNTYGNIDNYKIMPDIGDEVRPDAVLMVLRDYNNEMAPVAMSRDAVMRIDHLFDTANYLPLDRGRVVDIKVRRNMSVTPTLPSQMRKQLDKYYNGMARFYTEILDLYNELVADHRRRSGYVDKHLPMTPRFGRLVYDAMVFLDVRSGAGDAAIRDDMRPVLRPEIAKEPLDEYMVEITVEFLLIPKNGYKLSGNAGDKGVIGIIKPDADMPVDEYGNRAEVVVDAAPTIGRMIFSRPYAHYIAAGSREIRRRIRELAGWTTPMSIYDVEDLKPEVRAAIWDQILLISKCLPGPQYRTYLNLNEEDRNTIILTSLNKEVYLYNNPNDIWHTEVRVSEKGLGGAETCRLIRKLVAPPRSRVWYRNSCGELKLTKDKVRIAPLYHMLLEKTPQEYSAVATSTVQHQGLLSPAARSESSRDPYRNRTVRTKCEVGTRIDLAFMGAEATVETLDRYNNPETMAAQVQAIIEDAGKPKRFRMVDRNKIKLGGHRSYQLFKHALLCMGIVVRYVPPQFMVRRIHEQPNNHLENNDVTVPRS